MSMTFGFNSQINSCHFFNTFERSQFLARLLAKHIDTGYLVNATPPTALAISFFKLQVFWQGL